MNKEIFVQNVKRYCELRGVKPTNACKECGIGSSFLSEVIHRGRTPSVSHVQLLAQYLGVTTSELLGEEKPTPVAGDGPRADAHRLVDQIPPDKLAEAVRYMKFIATQSDME